MNFPSNLKYSKDHEWVSIDGDGKTGVVGITDFAQHELGDIVYVDINTVGDTVAKNVVFGTVEAVKTVSDLYMPIGGKVLEVNKNLETAPEAVNKDPYGDGWIIKIEITDLADIDDLMDSEEYKGHVGA